jgi:hypothetical protein
MQAPSLIRAGTKAALAALALAATAVGPAQAFDGYGYGYGCTCAGPAYPVQPRYRAGGYGCGGFVPCGGGFGFGAAGTDGGLGLGGLAGAFGSYGGVTYAPLGGYDPGYSGGRYGYDDGGYGYGGADGLAGGYHGAGRYGRRYATGLRLHGTGSRRDAGLR